MKRFEKHRSLFRNVEPTGLITAERDGYFDEQFTSMIEVPVEIRNRRTEVIFLVVDGVTESGNEDPDAMDLTADQFFGASPDRRHRSRQWMTLATNNVAEFGRVSGLLVEDSEQGVWQSIFCHLFRSSKERGPNHF